MGIDVVRAAIAHPGRVDLASEGAGGASVPVPTEGRGVISVPGQAVVGPVVRVAPAWRRRSNVIKA